MKKFNLAMLLLFIIPAAASCTPRSAGGEPETVELFLEEVQGIRVETWVENLEIPWSLLFLPEGRALVSERPGRIRLITEGALQGSPYAVMEVSHTGEGGLMGLAAHPEFPEKPFIYAMHTYREGTRIFNRVVRLEDMGDEGRIDRVIIDGIPGGRFHNGGRIAFGPDGNLYVTTGETFQADLAQDPRSLGGKILRLTPQGGNPEDNPFAGSPVYSLGHRNPQGLAWHPESGELFSSEHGPSGEYGKHGHDEINLILGGGNYGWPVIIGAGLSPEYRDPLILWKRTTPPSGITFYSGDLLEDTRGDLFVATLRSESLIRIKLAREDGAYTPWRIERWFNRAHKKGRYGRIRDVVEGPDGRLYFLTSNRDGRGTIRPGDDRIYRISPG
jgi:quinoprotein glucose dehydrogenase